MTTSTPAQPEAPLSQITQHLAGIENLAAAWLFGSRARGEHSEQSDYDIAIALNNFDLPYAERRLKPELIAQQLSVELECPVQVVDINLVPIPLAINVIEDGRPLLIVDELRYCREINRIHGLWEDHLWHKPENNREKQA